MENRSTLQLISNVNLIYNVLIGMTDILKYNVKLCEKNS